jgi:hypothetical protein
VLGPRSSRAPDTQKQEPGGLAHQPGTSKSRPQGAYWQEEFTLSAAQFNKASPKPQLPSLSLPQLGAAFSIAQNKTCYLTVSQARKFFVRAQEDRSRIPTDVMLLTRVYKAEQEPQLGIFLDPWELYLRDTLRLKSSGTYIGRVDA